MATVTIHDHELDSDTHNLYDVTIGSDTTIHTLVTTSASMVDAWIADTSQKGADSLVVGLDVEWRPNFSRHSDNPAATLQLCSAGRCLVFQLIHADQPAPASLRAFLDDAGRSFVGVGIESDVEKLLLDYGFGVKNAVDLGSLAARVYEDRSLKSMGLRDLARRVVGIEIAKPKRVTMGRWDNRWLNSKMVQYACVDAYVSYAIGKKLISGD